MIRDNTVSFATDLAYGGTPEVIDLGGTNRGKGQPIECFIVGQSLAGVSAVVVLDGTTASPATTRQTTIVSAAVLNAGVFRFFLPQNIQRYVTLSLTDASGGTYDAGIVIGSQSAA